jgi:hypothetical protein
VTVTHDALNNIHDAHTNTDGEVMIELHATEIGHLFHALMDLLLMAHIPHMCVARSLVSGQLALKSQLATLGATTPLFQRSHTVYPG